MVVACRVISFGSPKAGNDEFAGSVYATVGRIYRVVNSIDAVSQPLCNLTALRIKVTTISYSVLLIYKGQFL